MNRHQLQVSVPIGPTTPGGAFDTLDPGEAKTVGDYRVLAGNTYLTEFPTVYAYGRGCVPNDAQLVQVTVVFAP